MVAFCVRFSSPGPIIFKQQRFGYKGKLFTIFKFRSMFSEADTTSMVRERTDPRITPIGRVIRSTHLDELPQLVNVLLGDMSMVGPRPLVVPSEDSAGNFLYPEYFKARPGITGLVQIYGRTRSHQRGRRYERLMNRYYVRRQCLLLDCWILAKTPMVMVRRLGV